MYQNRKIYNIVNIFLNSVDLGVGLRMHNNRRKFLPTLVIISLLIAVITNVFIFGQLVLFSRGDPGNVSDSYYNATQLNVTVLQHEPRILWYDLQNSTGASMLNAQLDVNQEYYFYVNLSSDQKWKTMDYVNISLWHDQGNEANAYNDTGGANLNAYLQWENTSGIADWNLIWPHGNEVTLNLGGCSEVNVTGSDPAHSPGNTETYNLTFAWTPSYQFRYAQDPTNTAAGHNDLWSWNVNISASDDTGYYSYHNPTAAEPINEFGVFTYSEIITAGWPEITGNPGDNPAYNDSYIDMTTRSNGNYSLSVNATQLVHTLQPAQTMANTTIWTGGGDLALAQYGGAGKQWYYGGAGGVYHAAETAGTSLITNDIEWAVTIPGGQFPGNYQADIYYHLRTETSS